LCAEAAAAARRAGAPGALAIALMGTYIAAAMGLAAPGGAVPSSEEILAAAEAGGEREYAAAIRYWRAMVQLALGEAAAFAREVDGLATAAAATRVPEALWLADALRALHATVQ